MRISDWSSDVCSSDLESELAVRASMRQLEQWNADTFGYSAPDASQYLENERQLASLDRLPRARGANEVAPVLMAMVSPVAVPAAPKLGRASCRERVWQSMSISVVDG